MIKTQRDHVERFMKYVHKTDSCWLWTGTKNKRGYGGFGLRGSTLSAHRFSYEIHHGRIPDGLCVLHKCDNPPCVNPAHLFLGTQLENIADRVAKGRSGKMFGVASPVSKLTEDQVLNIVNDPRTLKAIALDYGVDFTTISYIKTGKGWAWLTGIQHKPRKSKQPRPQVQW